MVSIKLEDATKTTHADGSIHWTWEAACLTFIKHNAFMNNATLLCNDSTIATWRGPRAPEYLWTEISKLLQSHDIVCEPLLSKDDLNKTQYEPQPQILNTIQATDREHLIKLISEHTTKYGDACDLNHIDVSAIKNMSDVFVKNKFVGNISQWDVSNVTNMSGMFKDSPFNGDISKWNVSKVRNMNDMFHYSKFNGDISKWNISSVQQMHNMFSFTKFNGDISKWNVSSVIDMHAMFTFTHFTGDLSNWDVSNVRDMTGLFERGKFNGDLSKWNVSSVIGMAKMFAHNEFTGDISKWNVSNVKYMSDMFKGSKFNGDLSQWNVSNVTTFEYMFMDSQFNRDLSNWDVSNVINFQGMFMNSSFNGNITPWHIRDHANLNLSRFMSDDKLNNMDSPGLYHWLQAIAGTYQLKSTWLEHFSKIKPFLDDIFEGHPLEAAMHCQEQWLNTQLKQAPSEELNLVDNLVFEVA